MTGIAKTEEPTVVRALELDAAYGHLDGAELLRVMIEREFPGKIALASSFGAEAGILLSMVAEIDPNTPVLFLDTLKLFDETLRYKNELVERLGLMNLRVLRPDATELAAEDPDETLWSRDYDGCCDLRKVRPLDRALADYEAWITGRKRFHGDTRATLPTIEVEGGKIKINPLARWTASEVAAAFKAKDLPQHPLTAQGYLSIGCTTCTRRVNPDEAVRAGRWTESDKTECGIHKARWYKNP
ncbi:MAG: phosphoadenylyl-sulfate reductase [Alphaproteobacteria bacterium]